MTTGSEVLTEDSIRKEITNLLVKRVDEIYWMMAEALACKPWDCRKQVRFETFRDDEGKKDTTIYFYMDVPFMTCDTFMNGDNLQFNLRRIDDEEIITL